MEVIMKNNHISEEKRYRFKDVITGLSAIIFYLIMLLSQLIPLQLMNIDIDNMDLNLKIIYLLGYEAFTLVVMVFIFHEPLKKMWQDFKKNHRTYFNKYFPLWFVLLGLMMISNLIVSSIVGTDISANEEAINTIFEVSPIYIYLSAVIYAPIVEELTFRLAIRKLFKNDYLFIIVSGLLFGLIHVIGSSTLLEYLYIIPYSIPGFIFAYILVKSKNIYNTIGLHFVHNGVMMALQVLVTILM